MTFVKMIWPATRAVAAIPERAVDGHRGLGWVPLDAWREPEPETATTTDAPATDAEPASTKPSRRRGADTQE